MSFSRDALWGSISFTRSREVREIWYMCKAAWFKNLCYTSTVKCLDYPSERCVSERRHNYPYLLAKPHGESSKAWLLRSLCLLLAYTRAEKLTWGHGAPGTSPFLASFQAVSFPLLCHMFSWSQTLVLCTVSFTDLLLVSSVLKPPFVHAILEQHRWMSPSGNFSFEEYDSISRYIENSCACLLII